MTYLKKLEVTNEYICYAYGKTKECSIGTIKVNLKDPQDVSFDYFENNQFSRTTSQALMSMASFIESGIYPVEYLRATH